jgi:CotS family spore coat protein
MLYTNKGLKCLKKVDKSKEQIMFINEVKKHLVANGYTYIDSFESTKSGLPYSEYDEELYAVTNWLEGRECELENPIELKKAICVLAQLHKTMNGFRCSSSLDKSINPKINLGKWPMDFEKKINEMTRLRKEARKSNTIFDTLYKENFDYYMDMAKRALEMLKNSSYDELVKSAETENGFCHKDFTYHNIIIGENSNTYVIDFDYCCFELRIYDIASFIMRNMRRCNWDVDTAKYILEEYNKINPLSDEEYEVMKVLFIFPQKYWRVANRYYNKKHKHVDLNLYNKLCEEIMQKEFKDEFLKKINFI